MQNFLEVQSGGANPLEFLRLSNGYDLFRDGVIDNMIRQTRVETEITVNSSLSIKSTNFKASSFEETKGLSAADQAKELKEARK